MKTEPSLVDYCKYGPNADKTMLGLADPSSKSRPDNHPGNKIIMPIGRVTQVVDCREAMGMGKGGGIAQRGTISECRYPDVIVVGMSPVTPPRDQAGVRYHLRLTTTGR